MSKLPSSSLVRLVLTKNKLQKNLIYSWRFLRYASYHQSVIYESKLLSSSLAYLELTKNKLQKFSFVFQEITALNLRILKNFVVAGRRIELRTS